MCHVTEPVEARIRDVIHVTEHRGLALVLLRGEPDKDRVAANIVEEIARHVDAGVY